MNNTNFHREIIDVLNYGDFSETPLGSLVSAALDGDAKALAGKAFDVEMIERSTALALGLIADGVEANGAYDEAKASDVADSLRLIASLMAGCIAFRKVVDVVKLKAEGAE